MDNEKKENDVNEEKGMRKIRKEDLEKVIGGFDQDQGGACGCAATAPSAQTSAIT